ncbi:ABC transporter permease [Rhizobium sp. 0TCS1.26]|uniref:ABC transporter permease n=1 Tax=Rhizobium sp. 0TCS1.26 TaxID=3142623 RepID=UPI003D2DC284
MRLRPDKLGAFLTLLVIYGMAWAPFATLKPNRIVQGQARALSEALPAQALVLVSVLLAAAALIAFLRAAAWLKLAAGLAALLTLFMAIGQAADFLAAAGNPYARVSPASGFWLLLFAFSLMTIDALARLRPSPLLRIVLLGLAVAAFAGLKLSGDLDGLSVMKEYASRADSFWGEAMRHVSLAIGSLVAAAVVGFPVGLLCHRVPPLRKGILDLLNVIQTIPSMALFGLLIAPFAWIAANIPGASAIGVAGIGAAPAFFALFLYSLLPVVANTVAGLAGIPAETRDAARGIGLSRSELLLQVEIPLALPVILTAVRIVLVQNTGMATIAALIGGGGFGVFVFQGLGQMAVDLVLLGALPTVALAFAAATIMNAIVDTVSRIPEQGVRA